MTIDVALGELEKEAGRHFLEGTVCRCRVKRSDIDQVDFVGARCGRQISAAMFFAA